MNFINLKKIACFALLATFVSTVAFATIIPAGTDFPVMDGDVFSELIVSGTLVFANSDPMNPGGGTPLSITITNGDFILCNGGSISQSFDIGMSSSDGADGTFGTAGGAPPTDGDPGIGFGQGGRGGDGAQGSQMPPFISQQGANGGFGGDCGGNGGIGGSGGTGIDGMDPNMGGLADGSPGAFGGNGGNGGNGARGFSVTILNTTCDGKIVLTNLNVNLRGSDGGNGGSGGIGGNGGAGFDATTAMPPGPTGGNGGLGGSGGAGGSLSLIASNGYVYVPDSFFDVWFEGGAGGEGGPGGDGGNGGNGGNGDVQGGNGGDNGSGGNGGDGGAPGNSGIFTVLAAKVYTNSTRLAVALAGPLANAAPGGNGGLGGNPGMMPGNPGNPGGMPGNMTGMPGNPGNPYPGVGHPGSFSFTGDFIPPVLAVSDPVINPVANSGLRFTYQTNLIWNLSVFTDVFTEQKCLRHTIQIVNTNNPAGAAVSTIATDYYNIAANTNFLFSVQDGWQDEGYYFRFLTFDKGDNVTTNLYPGQTDNYFEVIPEPGIFIGIAFIILAFFRKIKR